MAVPVTFTAGLDEWLRDIAALRELAVAADVLIFRVTIPASGAITQPSPETLRASHHYFLTELRVGGTPATDLDDFDEVRFNVRNSDSKQNLFTSDIEVQPIFGARNGRSIPLRFEPGGYLISAGTTLTPTFTRRATTVTTARVVTVMLTFMLVPTNLAARFKRADARAG